MKFILSILFASFLLSSTYDEAKQYFDQKLYDRAKSLLQSEIDSKSTNAKTYALASKVASKLDELDDANSFIIKAIEDDPSNKEYREFQKQLELLKNGLKDAKKTFDSGYHEEAIADYNKLSETFPDNAMIRYTKGLVLKKLGNLDDAVESYKQAVTLNPFEDKYRKAILVVAQTLAKSGDEEFRRKEYTTALDLYKKSVSYYPEFVDGAFRLAKTYFVMKDLPNAQKWSKNVIKIDDSHVQAIKMLGDIYKRDGDSNKAIELYSRAIEINSNYDRAYYSLGVAYKDNQQYDFAIDALSKALLVSPTYTKAYETLGVVYEQKNDFDNAIANYQAAIEIDPKSYKVHYRLSSVYNIMKDYEKARDAAKECLRFKRNYAAAMCELGIAEMYMCNKVAAEDAFTKAKKDRNYRKFASDYLKNLNYYTKDCK